MFAFIYLFIYFNLMISRQLNEYLESFFYGLRHQISA